MTKVLRNKQMSSALLTKMFVLVLATLCLLVVKAERWQPKASDKLTWQYQLNSKDGKVNTSFAVNVYDIDLFETPNSTIKLLQSKGVKVVCYFSAGSYEGWRADWKKYFPFITGDEYTGNNPPFAGKMADWDERWLDIRRIDLLTPIMTARIKTAAAKGCDAIEPDNMDAYTPDNAKQTGINITYAQQLAYNRFIANTAHSYGLAVGLKNDVGQLNDLVQSFDFAVNEECFEYSECGKYTTTFIANNKAVFGVEYVGNPAVFCPVANARNYSFIKKTLDLYPNPRIGCEAYK